MTEVTFVDDCQAPVAVAKVQSPVQVSMKLTRKMTFLIGRAKISRLLQFQDPISVWICKVRL